MKYFAEDSRSEINSIAVIGNYPPRRCGIATFTKDLVESLEAQNYTCKALAINDKAEGYPYPEQVCFEINQDQRSSYRTAAKFINTHRFDIVSLQHEFGIFGGADGEHILELLSRLEMPVVTTLHTVLTEPTDSQRKVMRRLTELSDRFVVMSKLATDILPSVYEIPAEMIDFVPHGIPDMPFVDPNYYKDQFDLMGRKVLLTFGLLSENKGIEYVIRGLPKVVDRFPELTYIVLGATHPHTLKKEGERYRNTLKQLVKDQNLSGHVVFENHFVPFSQLCEYLSAADLYITPYLNEEQITSGTLAYAAGTGKAVISTPYWYAKEMLAEGRGRLVPFKDENAMAEAVLDIFENESIRHKMRKRAYDFNRDATWDEVAQRYINVFQQVTTDYSRSPHPHNASHLTLRTSRQNGLLSLPPFNADHLCTLTDDTGILQHAAFTVARRSHGYCTDDNARALIVAVKALKLSQLPKADRRKLKILSNRYLGFLLHAFNAETGRFRNFMSYSRDWLESEGSEDAHGRAIWALGAAVSHAHQPSEVSLASTLCMRALDATEHFNSLRAIAFCLIGLHEYLKAFSGDSKAQHIYSMLAGRLFQKYRIHADDDWVWLENRLTYCNGKVPHALILAGDHLQRNDMKNMGLRSLHWLMDIQTEHGYLVPVGNNGWFRKNGEKTRFDQQPLEASALIDACITAYNTSGEKQWLANARICFNWFLGENDLRRPLYDKETGGCRDGLQANGINLNEGAESTLGWLLSLMAMHNVSSEITGPKRNNRLPAAAE